MVQLQLVPKQDDDTTHLTDYHQPLKKEEKKRSMFDGVAVRRLNKTATCFAGRLQGNGGRKGAEPSH